MTANLPKVKNGMIPLILTKLTPEAEIKPKAATIPSPVAKTPAFARRDLVDTQSPPSGNGSIYGKQSKRPLLNLVKSS